MTISDSFYKNVFFVINQLNNLKEIEGSSFEIDYSTEGNTGWGNLSKKEVMKVLNFLQRKNAIEFKSAQEFAWDGDEDFFAQIELLNGFDIFFNEIKKNSKHNLYNPLTGRGVIKGKDFKFIKGSKPIELFNAICSTEDKRINRETVVDILGISDEERSLQSMTIRDRVAQVRRTTKLNTKEFVSSGGELSLGIEIDVTGAT